ncbi:hypothetical protein ACJMK2_043563 [Sinanodonta woodiana]|uniref:Uncharacterized protein n=1 Tax=Sinanodonta woodiana TaxID=1069815 RepID=A0ABD3W0H4_SINWO
MHTNAARVIDHDVENTNGTTATDLRYLIGQSYRTDRRLLATINWLHGRIRAFFITTAAALCAVIRLNTICFRLNDSTIELGNIDNIAASVWIQRTHLMGNIHTTTNHNPTIPCNSLRICQHLLLVG